MIGAVVLLAVLTIPIIVWAFVRWLPERRRAQTPKQPAPGPRKRWWQP